MDRMIYLSMAGAKQVELAQAANNHNLANATTTGFRADMDAFSNLPVYGPTLPSRVYASEDQAGVDLNAGAIVTTGRSLDVAVNGEGFIAVQAPDGSEAYTRAGDLRTNAQGILTTGTGHPVMGNGGPVALPPFERIQIGADGTISIQPLGQSADTLAAIDRIKLVNPEPGTVEKRPDGLLGVVGGAVADADASVALASGALETSNVNTVDAMVRMIELARLYEMNVKMMNIANENEGASAQLLSLS
jgi:flagellar basal-body rod protein FlgF